MKVVKGNIFHQECDALCITTNGYVNVRGECVMGRGIALQAAKMFSDLPLTLGRKIKEGGHNLYCIHPEELGVFNTHDFPTLIAFPVKPASSKFDGSNAVGHWAKKLKVGDHLMGFACVADTNIIENSCEQLVVAANHFGWDKVVLPKVGCGAGELSWGEVEYILDKHLDERFIICDMV